MAFCEFCGKKLEEGQVCDCQQAVNARQSTPVQPVNPQPVNPQVATPQNNGQAAGGAQNDYVKASKEAAQNAWKLLLHILKAPASGSVEYVKEGDMVSAIIMVVVQAFAALLFTWFNVSKVSSALEMLGISTGKILFVVFLCSLVASAALSGLVLAGAKIVKADCDFGRALRVAAARSIIVIPVVLLAAIFTLVSVPIASFLFSVSSLAGLVFLVSGIQAIPEMDKNKSIYVILAVVVVQIIVYGILFKVGFSNTVDLQEIIGSLMRYGSMFSGF